MPVILRLSTSCFNSRPCERGDMGWNSICCMGGSFNSRPCERGDAASTKAMIRQIQFQFTPLREGRHIDFGSGDLPF